MLLWICNFLSLVLFLCLSFIFWDEIHVVVIFDLDGKVEKFFFALFSLLLQGIWINWIVHEIGK